MFSAVARIGVASLHLAAGQGFGGGAAGLLAALVEQLQLLVGGEFGGILFAQDHAADRHLVLQAIAVAAGRLQPGRGIPWIEAQQQLALVHALAVLHQHRLHHAGHQRFDVLHPLNRLQLARHGHGFLQRCQHRPKAGKGHAAHQAPHQHGAVAVGFLEQHRLAEAPGLGHGRWRWLVGGFGVEGVGALFRPRLDRCHQLRPSSLWLW